MCVVKVSDLFFFIILEFLKYYYVNDLPTYHGSFRKLLK